MARAALDDIWHDVYRVRHRRDRDVHPCQLPLRLMERIVSLASDPGDVVFDGFMGTGSTALAARKLGRRFLGIEIDPAYIEIATAKLNRLVGL
ncbi:MAG: site-specific DNA-methyltransferase [Limnochordales bacterium]|nr:site-specific DNA-methyltransferase [Limnochordales bacterium]